jgi:hypothetical protein
MICLVLDNMKFIKPIALGSNNNIIITNPDSMFYFIPIPKNASTATHYFLNQYGWRYYQYEEKEEIYNKIPFTALREPVERWCSGFAQDFYHNSFSINLNDVNSVDTLFNDNINFGLHTTRQSFYLENIDFSKTYFLRHDHTYSDILEHFTLNIMKFRIFNKIEKKPSIMDYSIKNKIKKILEDNPKYLTLLKKYLEKDLDIYNSVKFYTG